MDLKTLHRSLGAELAQDGIPLHYGNLVAEYQAGLHTAVLLDRSHEGRLELRGSSRQEFLNRMSTNKITDLASNQGCATIFINANARVLDRVTVYNREDHLLVITDPGRGAVVRDFLQRQIFFNDDVQISDITPVSAQFSLHGPAADQIVQHVFPDAAQIPALSGISCQIGGQAAFLARGKSLSGAHWIAISPAEHSAVVYQSLLDSGKSAGMIPAGSLTFNTLRIRAGHPGRNELTTDYIPLELGLWDEVHFAKGCYTGQEIIARMESRARLSKTLVSLQLSAYTPAPAEIRATDQSLAGRLTSSVQAPDGQIFAMAVIKIAWIEPGTPLLVGDTLVRAEVIQLLGEQPAFIRKAD